MPVSRHPLVRTLCVGTSETAISVPLFGSIDWLSMTTPTTVPVRMSTANCQSELPMFSPGLEPKVYLDDRRGRLPQLEFPA